MPSARPLPQSVETQTSGHHRIALEMAGEEPQIGLEREFRANVALAAGAAGFRDFGNSVEHQHRRQRQLRAFGKQLAPAATQEILELEAVAPGVHRDRATSHWSNS
jgi:hypothetical protein